MILAAPLVIPFSQAVPALAGLTGLLGMAALSDKVNEYIQENPEESMKILSTIIPGVGIGEIFMSKESEDDVEVEDDGEEKKKSKKEIVLGELGKEKGNYSDPEAEGSYESKRGRIIRGLEDAGKIRKGPDPNYDPSKKFQGYKKFIRRRRADGGAIGIEVLFEEKKPRKDFNIGGRAQKTNTTSYDPRASIMDYGAALDKVGAGTQAEKSKSLGQYAKNYFTGLGEAGLKKLNPSVRSLAASYGIGKPISKFSELSPQVGQALQGAIMNTIKNPQQRNALTNSNISLKNIPVSSYTSYFKDRGVANTAGLYDTGYNSFADQLKDMAAALAGDASAIARTTYGRFNVDIDPEARTGFLKDTYDFSKKMPGSTAYGINMALPQKFIDEILNSAEYQKATGYKPPSQFPDYKTAALQSQFYKNNPSSLDFDLFKSAYAKATGGPKTTIGSEGQLLTNYGNYDPSRTYSSYMSNTQTSGNRPFFDQFVNDKTFNKSALLSMYGAPGYMKPYYADGGRVGLFMGGPALEGQALSIYNSMNAYGFTDQQIANALEGQGLYTPPGSSTPETTAPNIINQQIQTGGDDFSVYNPDPNKIKPFKPMGINFQNQKPSALSTGIAKMMDNPLMKAVGFAMNPPLAFAKGILSQAGSMMPVNERSIMENLAGNTGVRVDDIGRIVNTGKYNTPENVMSGYNLSQVTDKTFTDRIDTIGNTLQDKYGLSKEQVQGLVDGTLSEEEMAEINELGFNKTMGTTTNLITQIRNVKLAQDNIMNQKSIAAQMAEQQRKAKEAADALAIQQSGLTDLGNIQKIQQYTGKPLSDYRMSVPASQRNYTGGDTNPNPSTPGAQDSFSNKSGMGRTGYGEGGLATMFVEKR